MLNGKDIDNAIVYTLQTQDKAYDGYPHKRWKDVPQATNIEERVIEHSHSCMRLWEDLLEDDNFASLRKYGYDVMRILLRHDDPELENGDITVREQLRNEKVAQRKKALEEKAYFRFIGHLPPNRQERLIQEHRQFDGEIEEIQSPAIAIARFIDVFQGSNLLLTRGNDLYENSDDMNLAFHKRFVPYTNRCTDILQDAGDPESANLVRCIATDYVGRLIRGGVYLHSLQEE